MISGNPPLAARKSLTLRIAGAQRKVLRTARAAVMIVSAVLNHAGAEGS